jgi:cadmium resistance protein CadD (predicted permease)
LPNREALEAIDAEYSKADALAMHNQGQSDRMFKIFALMAASMGFLFLVYAKISAEEIFLILYLTLFVLGMVFLWWARRSRWFSKHLMYRVIAESMRTKFYLALAGVDRLVDVQQLIRLTGIDQFSGFSWVMTVFKDVEPAATAERMPDAALSRTVDFVHKEWIDGQASYFKRKSAQLSERHHRLERIKNLLLIILVLATLALLFFKSYLKPYLFTGISIKTSLVFLMGLLPIWLGVWELYQNQMATKELLWQYRNQADRFARTALQLSRTEGWRHQQPILAELGQRSLVENFLWTIHRYHRDYEPPVAA